MKPNELSELFNLSERKKYDILRRGATLALADLRDLDELIRYGVVVVTTEEDDPDEFPVMDVAVLTGYKVEDGVRKLVVRKLSDLNVSCTVTHAVPVNDNLRPVVLYAKDGVTPQTCRVVGYRPLDNWLSVKLIGDEDTSLINIPLDYFQAIKKDS